MIEFIKLILIGIVVGVVNVIPGVSGGTMAVVFNIYDKFVDAITLNFKKIKKNWKFIVPLLIGMLSGILIFSKIITILFNNFPNQTSNVFTGIVLGSIPMLYKHVTKSYKPEIQDRKIPSISAFLLIVVGLALMLGMAFLQKKYNLDSSVIGELPILTLPLGFKLFFGGFLGAVAMIIPGISGSFLMLVLGIYPIVITAIASIIVPTTFMHALVVLLPNGAGTLIGLLLGAKLISYLIKRVPNQTYAVIFGLILGSIIIVFPGFETWKTISGVIISIVCIVAGFAIAFFSSKNEGKLEAKAK